MRYFIFIFLIPNILALSNNIKTYFGNFKDARYNSLRNKYVWDFNRNILPIKTKNAKLISNSWQINEVVNEFNNYHDYNEFSKHMANEDNECVKWTCEYNYNIIKGLVTYCVNHNENKIHILKILPSPFDDKFNIDYLDSDLDQLLLNKEYEDYKICYEKINSF